MAETKYKPIRHDHDAFLRKAKRRSGFQKAYQALGVEYDGVNEMLAARARAGLTQEAAVLEWAPPKQRATAQENRATE